MELGDLPLNIRTNLEKTVEALIDKHESFKKTSFVLSVDNVVDDIMKMNKVKELTEEIIAETNYNDSSIDSSYENDDVFNANVLNLVVDKKVWSQQSKILRDQLLSRDNEVFSASYTAHYQLINNPETINDGTMNLIKALKQYFITVTKQCSPFVYCKNIKHNFQKNMLKIINMFFKALERISLTHKIQHIQTLIVQLMELINETITPEKLHFLHYASILDPEAMWFKKLTSFNIYRNVVIDYLKKTSNLVEYFANDIFLNMYSENDFFNLNHFVITHKMEIKYLVVKRATMYSYMYILAYIFSVTNENLFPSNFKYNGDRVTPFIFCKYLLNAANNFSNDPLQCSKHKHITNVLKIILLGNPTFLNDVDMQQKLILALRLNDNSRNLFTVSRKFYNVFELCSELSKTENGFLILFGCSSDKKPSRKKSIGTLTDKNEQLDQRVKKYFGCNREYSIADAIVNFTASLIKYFTNSKKIAYDLPYLVLNCCMDVLTCKRHIIYWLVEWKLLFEYGSFCKLKLWFIDNKTRFIFDSN